MDQVLLSDAYRSALDCLEKHVSSVEGRVALDEERSSGEDADRKRLANLATKLLQLCTDPSELLDQYASNAQAIACLRWLMNLEILDRVPAQGSISYSQLAQIASVPVNQLRSVTRMAITYGILYEDDTGLLSHSRYSSLLATNASFANWARFMTNYSLPTALKFPEATKQWGETTAKNQTAFQLAQGIDVPFFDHLRADAKMNTMFSSYMRNVAQTESMSFTHLVNGFDWDSLAAGSRVVDVGGSAGHASYALADRYPRLQFTVQDLPETIAAADKGRNAETSSSVQFQGHNFFEPQTLIGADVYLLRMIIHDWPHADALKILRNLKPALKPNSRIVIMDTVLPPPRTTPLLHERQLRVRDLTMQQVFNAKERELEDWAQLVSDAGLKIVDVVQPSGSAMGLLHVALQDEVVVDNGRKTYNGVTNGHSEPANGISRHADSEFPVKAPVLIIGAGVGGLCLAQGLKKAGIDFKVFERDLSGAYRPQGYRLKLEADAALALKQCLPQSAYEAFEASCALSSTGETDFDPMTGLVSKSRAGGGLAGTQGLRASFTVDRAVFRSTLMTGIDDHMEYGKELVRYDVSEKSGEVIARFKDGTEVTGSFLIGADGVRSTVRKQLIPSLRFVDTGGMCIYGKTPMDEELLARFPERALKWMTVCSDNAPTIQSILIGDSPLTLLSEPIRFSKESRQASPVPLPADYVYWVLIGRKENFVESQHTKLASNSTWDAKQSAQQSLDLTSEWHPSIRALFELQDVRECSTLRVVSAPPQLDSWAPSSLVTLLGDSIHTMSPCGGVGANTALRDAAQIADFLCGNSAPVTAENVAAYEEGLRKRAFQSITRSFAGSQKMFQQKPFGECSPVEL